MRTTITLDDDIAEAVDREMRKRPRAAFKEIVNELIQEVRHFRRQAESIPKFTVRPRSMELYRNLNYDYIGGLLEVLEGPSHR